TAERLRPSHIRPMIPPTRAGRNPRKRVPLESMPTSRDTARSFPPASPGHLGFGLGLRIPHYAHIFEHWPAVDFFEVISENFMNASGIPLRNLDRIAERYPVVLHGVCLALGASDPLDFDYLGKLKALARRVNAPWFSDHLCWTRHGGHHY